MKKEKYFRDEHIFIPERITRPILFQEIAVAFPPTHPIHERTDFVDGTVDFTHDKGIAKVVNVNLPSEEVAKRVDTICDILTLLSERRLDGTPICTKAQAYDSYSLIACTWLSIHGCLGVDGHGRATIRLLPITLMHAGYPQDLDVQHFYNINTGEFDIVKSRRTITYLYGNVRAGLRILAAYTELLQTGTVNELLVDPRVITGGIVKLAADKYAINVVRDGFKKRELF